MSSEEIPNYSDMRRLTAEDLSARLADDHYLSQRHLVLLRFAGAISSSIKTTFCWMKLARGTEEVLWLGYLAGSGPEDLIGLVSDGVLFVYEESNLADSPPESEPARCECGAHAIKSLMHSGWCPMDNGT